MSLKVPSITRRKVESKVCYPNKSPKRLNKKLEILQKIKETKLKEIISYSSSMKRQTNETMHQKVKKYFKMLCPNRGNFSISRAIQSQREALGSSSRIENSQNGQNNTHASWKKNNMLRVDRSYFSKTRRLSQPHNSSNRSLRTTKSNIKTIPKIDRTSITNTISRASKAEPQGLFMHPEKSKRMISISTDKSLNSTFQQFRQVPSSTCRKIIFKKKRSQGKMPEIQKISKIYLKKDSELDQNDSMAMVTGDKTSPNGTLTPTEIEPIQEEQLGESIMTKVPQLRILKENPLNPIENEKKKKILEKLFAVNYDTGQKSDIGSYKNGYQRDNPKLSSKMRKLNSTHVNGFHQPNINIEVSNIGLNSMGMEKYKSMEPSRRYNSVSRAPFHTSTSRDPEIYQERKILNPKLILKKSKKSALAINEIGILKFLNKK
ncbi:unnamed protein product [Moneuplotes crassus]|uniref:Uncharacterized protein n=1 Tax=Euplotes crassus TaxID=5936 RepID=A0AAD1UB59_EUPCR|nr:unnamed protein product [Moneuplotes crassus]